MKSFKPETIRYDGKGHFKIKDANTKIDDLYADDLDYEAQLRQQAAEIDKLQTNLYAHNRYGMLTVFQAMDAAGKDGTIQHVFTGTNPLGLRIYSFKKPTEQELEHDWLWRSWRDLPERFQLLALQQVGPLDHGKDVVLAGGKALVDVLVLAEFDGVGAEQLRQRIVDLDAREA